MMTFRHLVVALSCTVLPSHLQAQTLEIGPSVGFYRPFAQFDPASYFSSDLPEHPSDLEGIAWGGDVRVSFRAAFNPFSMMLLRPSLRALGEAM